MPPAVTTLPTTSPSTAVSNATGQSQTLTQNDFLNLLTAQLQHQDPLSPMSGAEFAAQLAQFSTATGVQALQTSLVALNGSITSMQATGLVGHKVAVSGNTMVLGSDKIATGAVNLPVAASSVKVTVSDSTGKAVADLDLGAMPAGLQTFTWNGSGTDGSTLPAGNYTYKVTASDSTGAAVAATSYAVVPVTAVTLGGQSGPMLNLGGGLAPVSVGAVQQVF
jgi:flagellar basal-body rod modification protein FlgD